MWGWDLVSREVRSYHTQRKWTFRSSSSNLLEFRRKLWVRFVAYSSSAAECDVVAVDAVSSWNHPFGEFNTFWIRDADKSEQHIYEIGRKFDGVRNLLSQQSLEFPEGENDFHSGFRLYVTVPTSRIYPSC